MLMHRGKRLTKTALCYELWPDDVIIDLEVDVANARLQQVVRQLRKVIEPNPSQPIYLITWRGKPEGGYQLFPNGQPQKGQAS